MGLFDFWRRDHRRGRDGSGVESPVGLGAEDAFLEEPGEGGPSLFLSDLAAMRWSTQQEAVNVGRMPLEPERWEDGRMSFEWERTLAHDHEGLRDRLSNFVSASARDTVHELYLKAGDVAASRDELRAADRDLGVITHSWNKVYRDVHLDELELDRYFRMKSRTHRAFKAIIALALFLTELAISTALFDDTVVEDNPAYPVLFALGLILILIVVPHYAAIGVKDGVTRYHEAELDAFEASGQPIPVALRRKARLEEVEDKGIKLVAAIAGLALVGLIIPLSSLRATHIGTEDQTIFWFAFFLLLQTAISTYFFLREWMDYGTAALNLRHQEESKADAERRRAEAFKGYAADVGEFMAQAQDLLFLYREAPRWDSYIIESYMATIHYFRHVVSLHHPDLDVFIRHASVPQLGTASSAGPEVDSGVYDLHPVWSEHTELRDQGDVFGRAWWIRQMSNALACGETYLPAGSGEADGTDREAARRALANAFENPHDLLRQFLRVHGSFDGDYVRPAVLDHIEDAPDQLSPNPPDRDEEADIKEPPHPEADARVDPAWSHRVDAQASHGGGVVNLPPSSNGGQRTMFGRSGD